MTASARFVMLVTLSLIAAAVLLAPRRDERIAMMRDQGQQLQVIALLEPRLAEGGLDPSQLAVLGRCYADIGNYGRAAELLERYSALRPEDAEGYALLTDVYKHTGNTVGRIAMLERHVAMAATLARLAELAELYRDERQDEKELALLNRFEAALTLDSGLVLRLAQLRAEAGDQRGAIDLLTWAETPSTPRRATPGEPERILLAELLVASGRSTEAIRLGKRWILEWRQGWLADRLLTSVALRAPLADAAELADAVALQHPEIRFFLVRELATLGAGAVARHLLETWASAHPEPSMNEIAAFLSSCRELNELGMVWSSFGQVLAASAPEEVILRYSEAIAAEFGIGALAPFWTRLPPGLVERRPLLAARLAFHERNPALAWTLLSRVDVSALQAAERGMWISLLSAVAPPEQVFSLLRERQLSGRLPRELVLPYARLAGELGKEAEYRAALAALRREARTAKAEPDRAK